MTVVWSQELAQHNIRAACVAPGLVRTELIDAMRDDMKEKFLTSLPLKRFGEVEEIAHGVAFIFENDFYTGRVLELDGGKRL